MHGPHLCRGPSNTSREVWSGLLHSHGLLPLGPGAHKTSMHSPPPPGMEPLFPPVLWKSGSPAAIRSQTLWGPLLLLPNPQAGKPDAGLRTITPVGKRLCYNCLWGTHLAGIGFDSMATHSVASPLLLDVGCLSWQVPAFFHRWLLSS